MIDFHSHILPKIDDGSKSSEMSVEMLKRSYQQGITHIVATPHFYLKTNNVKDFLNCRYGSLRAVEKKLENQSVPDIILGAEVYYFYGISEFEDLDRLCIQNTNYLLLEMPFERWSERIFTDIENIYIKRNITPVIAHLERYINFQKGTNYIDRIINMGYPIQVNAEYFVNFFTRGKAIKMYQRGIIKLLGSDCHNLEKRAPNLGQACDIISKKLGDSTLENITDFSKKILNI